MTVVSQVRLIDWGLRDYGIEGQLGLEKTPEEYVAKMVAIFAEVKRVLKPEGTLWLNLGDSYSGGKTGRTDLDSELFNKRNKKCEGRQRPIAAGLKPKDQCLIPHRVAMALQADGWYVRDTIIWHKPNPMPESVTDRCTKAHEYMFLLTKKPRYYFDAESIKEDSTTNESRPDGVIRDREYGYDSKQKAMGRHKGSVTPGQSPQGKALKRMSGIQDPNYSKRNKRSVWTVTTAPYSEAHFATFPPKLIEPCILAGCPEWVCKKCGKARVRVVDSEQLKRYRPNEYVKRTGAAGTGNSINQLVAGVKNKTTGWTDCGCGAGFDGGIVLDPFMGSGTTAMVAYENRKNYVGIELNPEYIKLNRADIAKEKYGLFE